MFKLIIEKGEKSFLPEVDAYKKYFESHGLIVSIKKPNEYNADDFDAVLLFHGYHPFWKKYPKWIIGEYHSLSTGRYGRIKDLLKRIINIRADVTVFLNEQVRANMFFHKSKSHAFRPMGYYYDLAEVPAVKKFDVVYAGSFRAGVEENILKIADIGMKVAVVGNTHTINNKNITSFGKVSVAESYRIMSSSKYGLNITPDIHPFNIQDSTKVIEYCAMGLGVITNKYEWVSNFEFDRKGAFLDILSVNNKDDIDGFKFIIPDISDLTWQSVMTGSKIIEKLLAVQGNN